MCCFVCQLSLSLPRSTGQRSGQRSVFECVRVGGFESVKRFAFDARAVLSPEFPPGRHTQAQPAAGPTGASAPQPPPLPLTTAHSRSPEERLSEPCPTLILPPPPHPPQPVRRTSPEFFLLLSGFVSFLLMLISACRINGRSLDGVGLISHQADNGVHHGFLNICDWDSPG